MVPQALDASALEGAVRRGIWIDQYAVRLPVSEHDAKRRIVLTQAGPTVGISCQALESDVQEHVHLARGGQEGCGVQAFRASLLHLDVLNRAQEEARERGRVREIERERERDAPDEWSWTASFAFLKASSNAKMERSHHQS